jgi:hypothetical protein
MTWTYYTPDFSMCEKIVRDGRCLDLKINWLRSFLAWDFIYQLEYLPDNFIVK